MEYVVVDKRQLEADLTTVSDSIRGLIESEEKLEFPNGMKEAIESYSLDEPLEAQDALIEQIKTALQGKAAGGDSDILITHIARLDGIFRNAEFEKEMNIALYPHKIYGANINMASSCNGSKNIRTFKVEYKSELSWVLNSAFSSCSELIEVDLGERVAVTGENPNIFSHAISLKKIKTELDLSSATSIANAFLKCDALEEVRFRKNSIKLALSFSNSSKLSAESIQSIIDGLADLTGGTGRTITFHKDVKTKLTETQIATITSKNWTLA